MGGFLPRGPALPHDRAWVRRLVWACRAADDRAAAEALVGVRDLHLAALALDPQRHWDQARGIQSILRAHLRPWEDDQADARKAIPSLTRSWEAVWGPVEDPRTAAKIEATVAALYDRDVSHRRRRHGRPHARKPAR